MRVIAPADGQIAFLELVGEDERLSQIHKVPRTPFTVSDATCPPPCSVVVYWYLPSLSIFIASSIAPFSSRSKPFSSSSGVFSTHTSGATPKFSRLMP